VALLNETAARFYFGSRNPIGASVRFSYRPNTPPYQIIGVVQDSRHNSLREEVPRLIYLPVFQGLDRLASLTVAIRTAGDPTALASAVAAQIRSSGPDILITDVITLARQVDQTLLEERLVSTLAGFFGLLALLLASIGLYGAMSYSAVSRTNEIGIRMALGASRTGVVWLVLRDTILMIAAGMAIGIPAAIGGARYIQSQLFGLKPADAITLVFASLLLTAVAVLAGYLPALRASRVDPMAALRYE
jgi:ABC-type antimicrobial peptide transport system permease subunit